MRFVAARAVARLAKLVNFAKMGISLAKRPPRELQNQSKKKQNTLMTKISVTVNDLSESTFDNFLFVGQIFEEYFYQVFP